MVFKIANITPPPPPRSQVADNNDEDDHERQYKLIIVVWLCRSGHGQQSTRNYQWDRYPSTAEDDPVDRKEFIS